MDDFVSKPMNLAQLAQVLARWLPHDDGNGGGRDFQPVESACSVPPVSRYALEAFSERRAPLSFG